MADQPEVRVKLSAEGMAEVVQAFQKIAAEGKKSAKDTGGAYDALGKQFDSLGKKIAGFASLAFAAEEFGAFFKQTLEGAESMQRLSAQTGLTTNAIQAFTRAARDVGVGQDQAVSGLARFTTAIGRAEIGTKQSAGALGDLGISIKTVASQNADQNLLLVAQRLAGIADPARRARDEMALFSRGGIELDQALVKLGAEGFAPFIAELQRLGLYLDTDTIASLEAAQRSFKDMHDEVKGLAQEFIIGLAPGLRAATDALVEMGNSGTGVSGIERMGQVIGGFLQTVAASLQKSTANIGAFLSEAQIRFVSYASAAANVLKGNFSQAVRDVQDASEKIAAIEDERERKVAQTDLTRTARPGDSPKGASPGGAATDVPSPEQQQALLRAKLQLTEAYLDNDLALYKAHAALLQSADKAAFEAGTMSLADYFAKRAQIINDEIDKEIAAVQAKRAAVAAQPVGTNDQAAQIQQQTELVRLDGQLGQLQLQRASLLIANTNEEADAQRKMYADTIKAEQTLLTLEGRKADAARLKLAADLQDLDAQLRKGGTSDADRGAAEGQFVTQGNAQIDFTDQVAKAQAALASLETARKAIQDQVTSGEMFSITAAQQILSLDRERLPALQAQADALVALGQKEKDETGNGEDLSKAEAYKEKIDEIAASTKTLAQQTAELKKGIEDTIGTGINKFFTDAEQGAKGFKNAFHDMAAAMEQDLLQIANKILEQAVLTQIFNPSGGLSSGGIGGFLSSLFGSSSSPSGVGAAGDGATPGSYFATGSSGIGGFFSSLFSSFAGGGQIRGPGSSTSDSIPLWASEGEFIVNSKATQAPGVLPLLQAINDGSVKRFAHGGLVSSIIVPKPNADADKNGRFMPGMSITQQFHIQAPHGSISRKTQKQVGAESYRSLMRAHQANN